MTQGTMELIQTTTVGSGGASSIDFNSIPQTYDDLQIVVSLRGTTNTETGTGIRFNGNSSAVYSYRSLQGNGSSASASPTDSNQTSGFPGRMTAADYTSNTFSNNSIYIPNYRGSTNKSFSVDAVTENNATFSLVNLLANVWANTSAITSITIFPTGGNFAQHSTATLYGITRVPAGAKATGGVIYDDSSFWYHVFTSSGTFTPSQNLTCDYLVVAGGGGGGCEYVAGGGGAGGYLTSTGLSLASATNYTVTIGAGGTGGFVSGNSLDRRGTLGSNSVFSTITATGGGGGGANSSSLGEQNGSSGGSGGGGGGGGGGGSGGAASPSGQGNGGGSGTSGAAGGGGGAGGSGQTGTAGGAGGAGSNATSTWATATSTGVSGFYAGGGGGSNNSSSIISGGSGGGGNSGSTTVRAVAGIINTGSGGGGGSAMASQSDRVGGNGGSGIVIVRYAK